MCGIIGFVTSKPDSTNIIRKEFMEQGLYVNALRGQHSTGLFTVKDDMRAYYSKDAVDARLFLSQSQFSNRVDDTRLDTWAAVGHNRYATLGEHTIDNAHPFASGHICMVHNGTLRGWEHTLPEHPEGTSDSARIAVSLAEDGVGGVNTLEKLRGDFALVWHDSRSGCMYFATNGKRPLSYIRTAEHVFFASESGMMEFLLNRIVSRHVPAPVEFEPYKLYTLKFGQLDMVEEEFEQPYFHHNGHHHNSLHEEYGGWIGHNSTMGTSNARTPAATVTRMFPAEKNEEVTARTIRTDNMMRQFDLSLRVGHAMEINVENTRPYETTQNNNRTEPLGEVQGFWCHLDNNMKETVYHVRVHQAIMSDVDGGYVDSVVGELGSAFVDELGDLNMVCIYKEVGAYRTRVADEVDVAEWPPFMDTHFKGCRHHYNEADSIRYGWFTNEVNLTAREMDIILEGKECQIPECGTPYTLVPRSDVVFTGLDEFVCRDCTQHQKKVGDSVTLTISSIVDGVHVHQKRKCTILDGGEIIDDETGEVYIDPDNGDAEDWEGGR